MKFGFGENDKLGKIDFDKLISGLSKNDLHIIDDFTNSLFDSIDTDNNGTLSKKEISIFESKIKELAGDDGILSVDEAGLFKLGEKQLKDMETYEEGRIDSDGNALLHQKIDSFFSFLEALSSKTEGINGVKHKSDCQVIKYENGIEEIQYTNGRIVIKENNKVIYDSEAKVVEEKTTNVTDAEFYMINYLKDQIKTAKYIIETADDNTSITGALVDWWCRLDILGMENNHPLDKMDEVVKELERNVLALEKAAKNSPEEYNRVCKEKFGIDFNAAAVEEFMFQANEYELISQQHAIYDIVCHPEKYRGGHGHAAANQVASYRENAENFLLVCDAMGYSKEDVQAIIDQAVEQFNKTNPKYPYEYARIDMLQNPDNKYFMAQRKGGGYDVDWGPLAGYAFDILRDKVEADLNKLHNTNSFEEFYKQKTDAYNSQLKEVLGVTNVVDDATGASEEYQGDVASLNNAFMMITMVTTLASGGLGILANFMKGVGCVARCTSALNTCNNIIRITSGVNKYLSVAGTIAATNPIGFVDQLFSENGMTAEAFASWGKGVLQNCAFMGLGMCASNFAMRFASWYKAGQLAKLCKSGGQTFDDLMTSIKNSPQKFPPDLVKSLKSINRSSMMLQISAETLMDFGFSAACDYAMMGDDYKIGSMDFWMSLAFSINGGFNEKIMRDLNTQKAKAEYINKALEEMRLKSPEEQNRILDNFRRENNIDMDNAKLREQFKDFKLDKKEITKMVAEDDNFKAYTLASMIYGKDGCILQKGLSVLSNDAKAKYVQDALRDFNLSYEDAWRVVEYMDVRAKGKKVEQVNLLDEAEVIYKEVKQRSVSEEISRLAKVEEIDLPKRVRGLDDGATTPNYNMKYEDFCTAIRENEGKAEIFKSPEGYTIAKVRTTADALLIAPGVDSKYACFVFDKDGNMIRLQENMTEAEFKSQFSEYEPKGVVRSTSGTLNSGFNPLKLLDMFKGKNPIKYLKNIKNKKSILEYFKNDKKLKKQAEYFVDKLIEQGFDFEKKRLIDYHIKRILDISNKFKNSQECLDLIANVLNKYENYLINDCFISCLLSSTDNSYNYTSESLLDAFKSIEKTNLSQEQILAVFNKGFAKGRGHYRDFVYDGNDNLWKNLAKMIPSLKNLSPEQIKQLDIYNLAQLTDINYINYLTIAKKIEILDGIKAIPNDVKQKIQEAGFDIKTIEMKLKESTTTTGFAVRTDKSAQKRFLKSFIVDNPKSEAVLGSNKFKEYLSEHSEVGIPLKYSRKDFIDDLNSLLDKLPIDEKNKVLEELNISLDKTSFSGFVKLNEFKTENYSKNSQLILKKIRECVDNFAKNNEVICPDPEIKSLLDDIIQGFPEFTSIIGKSDAGHTNKLDIHILQVLNSAISNPKYSKLTNQEKKILKFSILLHDLAKKEGFNGEHSSNGAVFARSILSKFNLNDNMNYSIVNLIKNHHYSEGSLSWKFEQLFRTDSEKKVAIIMAESDYFARFNSNLESNTISNFEYLFNFGENNSKRKDKNLLDIDKNSNITNFSKIYEFELNGKTVKIPILDMRDISPDESASNYGWFNNKKLSETNILVHNCESIENIKTVLESQLDPNFDITLSTRLTKLTQKDFEYGKYQLILSSADSNIGAIHIGNAGTGNKKGFAHFIYNQNKNHDKSSDDIVSGTNEILIYRPKVEQIAIIDNISPEDLPPDLIELSHKFKIPIIILGGKK